jgi:hypothetical protein
MTLFSFFFSAASPALLFSCSRLQSVVLKLICRVIFYLFSGPSFLSAISPLLFCSQFFIFEFILRHILSLPLEICCVRCCLTGVLLFRFEVWYEVHEWWIRRDTAGDCRKQYYHSILMQRWQPHTLCIAGCIRNRVYEIVLLFVFQRLFALFVE